jgi:hypothetical protein
LTRNACLLLLARAGRCDNSVAADDGEIVVELAVCTSESAKERLRHNIRKLGNDTSLASGVADADKVDIHLISLLEGFLAVAHELELQDGLAAKSFGHLEKVRERNAESALGVAKSGGNVLNT